MLSVLTPLSIGAAATAVSSVASAIPTPSDFAAALQRATAPPKDPENAAANGNADKATSRTDLRRLLRDVEKSLAKLFGRGQVDTSQAVRFQLDESGGVQANADHPDAAKIDALLAADKHLMAAIAKALRSIDAETSPELLSDVSRGGASIGEPKLTFVDGTLSTSLAT